jgi:hypothetical protein
MKTIGRNIVNELHQPASEKAKAETKPRFHAGRLDAFVLRSCMFYICLCCYIFSPVVAVIGFFFGRYIRYSLMPFALLESVNN